jgi:hypothetical protein
MTVTPNRYATNDSDLRELNINNDLIKTDIGTIKSDLSTTKTDVGLIKTSTTNIEAKIGEVQAVPTANTVLGRLKNIETNTTYLPSINFSVNLEITRPANTTGYTKGDIVNNNGSIVLPEFNFTSYGDVANRQIIIKTISVTSNRTTGAPRIDPYMYFFHSNTFIGQDLTDNMVFDLSYSEMTAKKEAIETNNFTLINDGSNCYLIYKNNLYNLCTLDSNKKLYLALVPSANYTPVSAEKFYVTIKGTIL